MGQTLGSYGFGPGCYFVLPVLGPTTARDSIGLVAAVLQPVVVSNQLKNIPLSATYNWNPGAHFGIYKPDTFWFATVDGDQK